VEQELEIKRRNKGKRESREIMREDGPQFAKNDQVKGNSGWNEETIIEQI